MAHDVESTGPRRPIPRYGPDAVYHDGLDGDNWRLEDY